MIMLWAALALAACTQDPQEDLGALPQVGDGSRLEVRACADGEDSRVATADGLNFTLVEGQEQIGLYLCESAWTLENILFKATGKDPRGWLTFATDVNLPVGMQSTTNVLAYAPYRKTQWSVSGTTSVSSADDTRAEAWNGMRVFDLPTEQTQAKAGDAASVADYYALAAYPTTPTASGDGSYSVDLRFAGVFAVVRFNVSNATDAEVTVNKLTLTAGGSALTGLFRADLNQRPTLTDDTYTVEPVEGNSADNVTVQLGTPIKLAAGSETSLYAVVRAGEIVNPVIRVYGEQSGEEVMFERWIERTVNLSRKTRTQFSMPLEQPWQIGVEAPYYMSGKWGVSTAQQLAWVAERVNSGATTFEGEEIVVLSDIDLDGRKWMPIGKVSDDPTKSRTFAGTFDFNGYNVYNMYVEDLSANNSSAGFFGSLSGVAKNGRFYNAIVKSRHYAGVVAGYSSSDQMSIENCHVIGTIAVSTEPELVNGVYTNGCMAGGIIGYCGGGRIENCSMRCDNESFVKAYCDLGGIVGGCGPITLENNSIMFIMLVQSNKNGYKSEEITTVGAFVGNDNGATHSNNNDQGAVILMGQ